MDRLSAEEFAASVRQSKFDYKVAKVQSEDRTEMKRVLNTAKEEGFRVVGCIRDLPYVVIFFARLHREEDAEVTPGEYRIESEITVDLPKNSVYQRRFGWKALHIKRWTAFDLESFQEKVCVTFFAQEVGGDAL